MDQLPGAIEALALPKRPNNALIIHIAVMFRSDLTTFDSLFLETKNITAIFLKPVLKLFA